MSPRCATSLDSAGLHVVCPGEIPPELGDLGNLTSLNLEENQLSGKIPAWLADVGESSGSVKLYSNEFECAPSSLKGWILFDNVPDC